MSKIGVVAGALIISSCVFSEVLVAGDVVQFPSGPAAWTVKISQSPSDPPAARKQITSIEVAQDGQMRHSIITWSSGTITEKWDIPGQNLILVEDTTGQPYCVLGGSMGAQVTSLPFGPSDFTWLKPELLQEKNPVTYGGKQCFHYKGFCHDPHIALSSFKCEAWIDSTTHLPVALDDGESLGIYTFSQDPPPPLTLPAKFANVFERHEEGMGLLKPIQAK